MDLFNAVLLGAKFVSSTSVTIVVKNAIKMSTPGNLGRYNKLMVFVGGTILSGMASEQASKYVEGRFKKEIADLKKFFVKNDDYDFSI